MIPEEFLPKLYARLCNSGFTSEESSSDLFVVHSSPGSILYVVAAGVDSLALLKVNQQIHEAFDNDEQRELYRHVFIVTLFITETDEGLAANQIALGGAFNENDFVYEINWWLRLDTHLITHHEDQPNEVLTLRKQIRQVLFDYTEEEVYVPKHDTPYVSLFIIIINALILALMEYVGGSSNTSILVAFGAIEPNLMAHSEQPARLITAMFLHIGLPHFIFNSITLYIFGTRFENCVGPFKFLTVYILSGAAASIASLLFSPAVAAGASGAIYGIIGALAVYTKKTGRIIEGVSSYTMVLFIAVGIAMGFMIPNIGNFAHLGGLVAGAVIGYFLS